MPRDAVKAPIAALRQQLADEILRLVDDLPTVISADLLCIDERRMADLRHGRAQRFSVERLIRMLAQIDRRVDLTVVNTGAPILRWLRILRGRKRNFRPEGSEVPLPSPQVEHMRLVIAAFALTTALAPLRAQATQAGQAAAPDTPAGRVLRSWLDAFNSGDATKMDAYYQRYEPDKSAEAQMGFRNDVGGFDLLSIEKSQPGHVEFLVKERKGERRAYGAFDLPAESGPVKNFVLQAIPPGGSVADFRIDAAERARVIEGAIAKLDESYVFPETAKRMADSVRARQKRGEYEAVTNGASFARLLTEDFQAVSHDRHLRVNFSPRALPAQNTAGPNPDQLARMRRQMEQINCGFVKVEQLEGNVGYVKFNMFADPDICGPTASAAMSFVANSDALIVDLRDNGGGDPKMVAYICSYLFSQKTHVNDLWTRKTNSTQEYWTSDVPGKKLGDRVPVYVLTSKRTFSGAEEFTYNLKSLKRATIVGETTGGGAHPVNGQRIDEHFIIGVPFARAINPITKTNWEGTGVEPDVKVPAADALSTAQKLAADKKPATD